MGLDPGRNRVSTAVSTLQLACYVLGCKILTCWLVLQVLLLLLLLQLLWTAAVSSCCCLCRKVAGRCRTAGMLGTFHLDSTFSIPLPLLLLLRLLLLLLLGAASLLR
jgi:hypothetical protein